MRPVVVEYKGHQVKAKFELVNEGLAPLNVVLEPKSFDVSETGDALYRALDPGIHLRLSEMSFRIPPRQSHIVFFEVRADTIPAWFVIPCTFVGMPKPTGIQIQVELPHTVYLLQKDPLLREDVEVLSVAYRPDRKGIVIALQNRGPRLGRALGVEVSAEGDRQSHPSFPLLPGRVRQVLVPWDRPRIPEKVTIRFQGFSLELPVAGVPNVSQ